MGMDNVPRCQHLKMNGTQCGSPALRWRRLCFFHERIRRERAKIAKDTSAQRRFDLPLLEDANSVQVALMKVIQMLGSGRMDHRTAGLMLYALQTASSNLRNAEFEAADEAAVAAAPTHPAAPRKVAKEKHVTLEEARMQVQGVVRNWLSETRGEQAAVKPG